MLVVEKGGAVDPSLRGLFPRIREAVEADAATIVATQSEPPKLEIATLIASIRDAFEKDERLFADEDALIAKQVSEAIPRLVNGISAAFEEARRRLLDAAPWALAPLESELDLLSPLGRARQETAHTQFLAWLMDCRHPHGLGVTVLREFFRLLGQVIPGEDSFEALSRPTEEDERRLRSVRVSAEEVVEAGHAQPNTGESRRCDVWIELVEEGRSLIVVIENKVDAGEHGDQLSAYEGAVWQRARLRRHLNFEARLVFLTPEGRSPGDEADKKLWTPISYRQLACALARASNGIDPPPRPAHSGETRGN